MFLIVNIVTDVFAVLVGLVLWLFRLEGLRFAGFVSAHNINVFTVDYELFFY